MSKFELFLGAFSDIFHAATVEAESLTRQSLQTFQEFNRRRLQADALKLLGEIYKHRLPHQPATAAQFFQESRQLYQELDLTEKAIEIESLW